MNFVKLSWIFTSLRQGYAGQAASPVPSIALATEGQDDTLEIFFKFLNYGTML